MTNREADFDDGMKAGIFYLIAYPMAWLFLLALTAVSGACWWAMFTFDGWQRWVALGLIAFRVIVSGRKWVDEVVDRAYLSRLKKERGG